MLAEGGTSQLIYLSFWLGRDVTGGNWRPAEVHCPMGRGDRREPPAPCVHQGMNHRKVWVGRDLKDHPVPTPCHRQGHLPPAQAAPSPVQPGLEPCQGWGTHSCSGQPGPAPRHPLQISCIYTTSEVSSDFIRDLRRSTQTPTKPFGFHPCCFTMHYY